jgi:hypothetical protein
MKNVMGIIAIAAVVLQLVSHCVQAENVVRDKESLRGIKRIGVTVGKISHNAKKMGINRDALRRGIELKLRGEGINVANADELHADSEIPYLQVIFFLSYSKPAYMYTVMIGLNEKVHLARDPKIISYAMPWWRIIRGEHIGKIGFEKEVEDALQKHLKEFVSDYFSVNPKQAIK